MKIELTPAQIADVVADYGKSNPVTLINLTQVRSKDAGVLGVVLIGSAQRHYAKDAGIVAPITVVNENGDGSSYSTERAALAHWDLVIR